MSSFDAVREIIALALEVSPDAVDATTERGGIPEWDSLGHVNMMVALEAEFDVLLEPEDFEELTSVAAIVAFVDAAKDG